MTTASADPGRVRVETAGTTDALPIAPALDLTLDAARMPRRSTLIDRRVLLIAAVAIVLAIAAALVAQLLTALIGVVTNLAFYGPGRPRSRCPQETISARG
ncbi:hypothetical protein GCM10009105_35510 [Dokdonella soli]|uniref:Uncharacterized protein n=1 Tax=Dokdonella soli TaxID=529810 RepID=A0ABP3U7Q9_9GAMM